MPTSLHPPLTFVAAVCAERKRASRPQLNARIGCRRGARTVVHTYQQNLS
jgi:hypothetical protein